jgi:putative permease
MASLEQALETAFTRALRRQILLAFGLYLLLQFLGAVTFVVLLFVLVFLLAAALNPVVAWLQRHHVPRPVSAVALALLAIGGTAAVLWFLIPPLLDQGQQFLADLPALGNSLRDRLERFLAGHPGVAGLIPPTEQLGQRFGSVAAALAGHLGRYTLSLVSLLAAAVLLGMLVIYCLASPQPLVAGLLSAFPAPQRARAEQILALILARLKAWALGSLLLGVIVGGMIGIGLFWLKVPFVLVFALIAGVGELIPNLGPLLSAVPPVLVALAADPMQAVWVAVLFLVVQQIENNLIVPLVMARAVDVHPLSVTFMMLAMGALLGVIGALIALPTVVVIKTLYQELYLKQYVSDPEAVAAQSDRIVGEQTEAAEARP